MMFQLSSSLDDCVLTLKRGISPRYSEDGVIVINQRCIRDGRVVLENARRHDEKARTIPDDRVIRQWDVLVNSTGVGTLGRVAQFTTEPDGLATVDSHVTIVRPDLTKLDGRFFGYVMRAREPQITSMGEGATGQTELSRLRLGGEVLIPEPPLPLQRTIGSILGSIDDLIENNRRRIEVLEEMAQAIYREWFVHFRFPGHEHAALIDSPLGPIPEGWDVKTVGDVLELKYGKALKKDDRVGGDVAVVGSSGVVGYHNVPLLSGPTIVVGRKGNVGNVIWLQGDNWPIDTTYYVETALPLRYVAEQLRRAEFINSHAAVPGLSRDQAYSVDFLVPSAPVMNQFAEFADLCGLQAETLARTSNQLSEVRDLLLPKLVSGEIDVSDLDLDAVLEGAV